MAPIHRNARADDGEKDDNNKIFWIVFGLTLPIFSCGLYFFLKCLYDIGRYSLQRLGRRSRVARDSLRLRACSGSVASQTPLESVNEVAAILQLPEELALSIFLCLLHDDNSNFQSEDKYCEAQRDLAHTSRTCKLWHRIGGQLSYQRPVPLSEDSLLNFSRTVSEGNGLACRVEDLVLLRPGSCLTEGSNRIHGQGMCAATKKCIRSCTQLSSLTLGGQVSPVDGTFISPRADYNLYTKHGLGRLSRLTITDSLAPWGGIGNAGVQLLVLEALHLRRASFTRSYRFPALPKLHTLCIVQPSMPHEPKVAKVLDIDNTSLPALRSFQVHEAVMTIRLCPEIIRNLETLVYLDIGAGSHGRFFWANSRLWRHSYLRCMSFIVWSRREFKLPTLKGLLPKLENLTIIVPCVRLTFSAWTETYRLFISELSRLLQAGSMTSLKKITVVLDIDTFPASGDTDESSPTRALRHQCTARCVDMDVKYIPLRDWTTEATTSSQPVWLEYQMNEPVISEIVTN